ncbi:hypothetical protein LQ953_13195 [Sphingomonas sp. IC-56]|uniref:hypothetical protein n=1 Tax=Sphingomonas sp. IC-56 TaxID=2898529 RepID=UPI001E2FA651|nr:hypothetical protein [Sphingomonas sp. IC-56]MCD2324973.1 hypothetical protein [Sphingomonas sp. IC-56]
MTQATHLRVQQRVEAEIARVDTRAIQRAQGLAWARAWRIRNKPRFDALYGEEPCACGRGQPASRRESR